MKFVLYCESNLTNIEGLVKEVNKLNNISVKNVFISSEDVLGNESSVQVPVADKEQLHGHVNTPQRRPYIAEPSTRSKEWSLYDDIKNMPTL